jgi:type I restriction enzyme M protein
MDTNEKIKVVGINIQEKASLIWNVANSLFGAYKPHEYGLVILPMVVIKRFHDCLLPYHDKILETYEKVKHLAVKDGFLRTAAGGYKFYNTSPYTFDKLKADPENIKANFESYINGFSDNVIDILANMGFFTQIERMADAGVLYQVISDFTADNADMSPEKISAIDMGYVFENLVQRFSESYDEEAGAHFTSRDIIYLMCDLLTMNADFSDENAPAKTVYDMAMGTSQMLTCMEERIHALDKEAEIICYGQEINPFTFGIAKADMLIRGGDPENMQFGNTLNADKFSGYTFDYIISNPPFGIDWKREAADIEAEHKKGDAGRFGVGLPQKSDGQMLFLLNGIAKLKDTGRMAIIQNGSSLFTGDAGSGPSEIRRYIIENDWLDAIVQLPNDSFYNTGIATYIWIITKDKPETHREKILLIDASQCYETRRRPIGNKRVDINEICRDLIIKAYGEYRSAIYTKTLEDKKTVLTCKSKVMDAISLGYNKITIESPMLDEGGNPVLVKGKPVADTSKRDTENVPLDEDVDAYFEREVLPYRPGAWVDKSKTKIGYEIPFTRTFYEYSELEPAADIAKRIQARERVFMEKLRTLFGNGGGADERD